MLLANFESNSLLAKKETEYNISITISNVLNIIKQRLEDEMNNCRDNKSSKNVSWYCLTFAIV
jgi:hypothetical protein